MVYGVNGRHARIRRASRTALLGASVLLVGACSGGSGGSGESQNTGVLIDDPVIPLVGPTGTYSMTPEEANSSLGAAPPPVLPAQVQGGRNQYLRLEAPFTVDRSSILSGSPLQAPFSYLNGNISFTDENGQHLPGIAIVNGFDAFGVNRTGDPGFPTDPAASGADLNVGAGVILYVADDGDNDLSTIAAFGGRANDSDGQPSTTDIRQIRVTIGELNGVPINGFYTVTVDGGTTPDIAPPSILSVGASIPSPAAPLDPTQAAANSQFIVRFSEPCVPSSVGNSSQLDPEPFTGNMPLLGLPGAPPPRPFPRLYITASFGSATRLFVPCDVNPMNSNNLATYVVQPLIDLPPTAVLELTVVDANLNINPANALPEGPIDLTGNLHSPGVDQVTPFTIGPGRNIVNAPVSPHAVYWLPASGRGIGAVDLNGFGFNTNTPGANAGDYRKAAIIAQPWSVTTATGSVPLYNPVNGIALDGHPAGLSSGYAWPVGTGGYSYGPGDPNSPLWAGGLGANDLGNPGTPVPGVNEMSSGFETLVRDAGGGVILTGEESDEVGVISDAVVGEFLDVAIFDTLSFYNSETFHASFFWGGLLQNNSINEPPVPNPPPSRYWVGLNPVDILIDQSDPGGKARLIEGEEIWAGDKSALTGAPTVTRSFQWMLPNPDTRLGFDVLPPQNAVQVGLGPSPENGSFVVAYNARQQIGNYLYVTDIENKQLHAINSNTFETITSIDLPDPTGLAIDAGARFVFVSNASDDSVSVVGADPRVPDFHTEVARIPVGRGPDGMSAQPNGEDLHVCNFLDDSITIIDMGSLTVRKTVDALISGPVEVITSPRENGFGWFSGIYFAYYANLTGNSVVVYESGPDGPQGIGCDNVLGALPTEDSDIQLELFAPRGMCYSPYPNDQGFYSGGVFVAHRDNQGRGLISEIKFTHQATPGPQPCVPPGGNIIIVPTGFIDRAFEITGQWGRNAGSALLGSQPTSVVLPDSRRDMFLVRPPASPNNADRGFSPYGGLNSRFQLRGLNPADPRFPFVPTYEPERMYVAFQDTDDIQVLDPLDLSVSLGTIEGGGVGVKKLVTYFQQ